MDLTPPGNDDTSETNCVLDESVTVDALRQQKLDMEAEFGIKRAKFMELFTQKEEELAVQKQESDRLQERVSVLQRELDEARSHLTVMECTRDGEAENEKQRYEDEISSLQQVVQETLTEAGNVRSKYEAEVNRLRKNRDKLEVECQELRAQLTMDREGVLSMVTKTLAKRVNSLNPQSSNDSSLQDSLEESMKKAQEDAEMLRSLVVPLEEEIKALKDKLRAADDELRMYEATQANMLKGSETIAALFKGKSPNDVVKELDEKLQEANAGLQAEKSSRTDLELYVTVLQTQNTVLREDNEKLRSELKEVFSMLDLERRDHRELKRTWQMANDQFLESQRLQLIDLRRVYSVLSTDQKRQIAELQKKEEDRIEKEKKAERLAALTEPKTSDEFRSESPKLPASLVPLALPLVSSLPFPLSPHRRRKSPSPSRSAERQTTVAEADTTSQSEPPSLVIVGDSVDGDSSLDVQLSSTSMWLSPDRQPSLSENEVKALLDMTPEQEARKQQMDLARSPPPSNPALLAGRRLVGEKEWQLLQDELHRAYEGLNANCVNCQNSEFLRNKALEKEKELTKQVKTLEKSAEWCRSDLAAERNAGAELEERLLKSGGETQQLVDDLKEKLEKSEKLMSQLGGETERFMAEASSQLQRLTVHREQVQRELIALQRENDALVGRHSHHSQEMEAEAINLPDTHEEMQLLLLRLREELIAAKVAREHIEAQLKSETLFLKDQLLAEQQNKESVEDGLHREIEALREKVAIVESIESELRQEQKRRSDAEHMIRDQQQKLTSNSAKSKQLIQALQKQVEENIRTKEKLQEDVANMRIRIQTLQTDLDNSEAVQKDFVKLSQSLQVQLEKIRESEKEVRWQHEEDVDECNNCKQSFTVTKRRHHCRHCGKIFCADCTSKTVTSGPHQRPSKVCGVCHTLLVRDTAPYFSKEPPHTPD